MFRSLRFHLALAGAAFFAAALLLSPFLYDFIRGSPSLDFDTNALTVGLVFAALGIFFAITLFRSINQSLDHLADVARRIGAGDFSTRARPVNQLGKAMNQMAEQLEASRRSIQNALEQSGAVLAHMTDGFVLTDPQGKVIQLNPAAETILGVRAADALGKSFTQAARDHEMAACLRDAQSSGQETTRVIEQVGTRRFLRIVATPIQSQGAPTAYLIMLQDLTSLRRLETIRRDFISNVSHELRTPLAGLQALVETLNSGALEDLPAARQFVARMDDEVRRLNQLVNELLELSALEAGKAPLEKARVEISAIVARAAERLRLNAERAGVRLEIAPMPMVVVNVDAARIEQVLLNLIHNAIKFTPAGGIVECRVTANEAEVTISVRDTGIGIAENDLPRIFERFYKADQWRARGGTGLGLAIAKHIVELHGGRIWAESTEGKGAVVHFTLPLA